MTRRAVVASEKFPINVTGPYVFQEAIPDQFYRFAVNGDYRLDAPGFEEVCVVDIPHPGASTLTFEVGEVDMIVDYPETDFARIQDTSALGFVGPTTHL